MILNLNQVNEITSILAKSPLACFGIGVILCATYYLIKEFIKRIYRVCTFLPLKIIRSNRKKKKQKELIEEKKKDNREFAMRYREHKDLDMREFNNEFLIRKYPIHMLDKEGEG